jgi:hypothetical protein
MMNLAALSQIEERIAQLSLVEQLWLIERVAQRLRDTLDAQSAFDQQLAAMAADQEIQQELRRIEEEFAHPMSASRPQKAACSWKRSQVRSFCIA